MPNDSNGNFHPHYMLRCETCSQFYDSRNFTEEMSHLNQRCVKNSGIRLADPKTGKNWLASTGNAVP